MKIRFADLIASQRELLGPPPRSFGFFQRWHWRIKPPPWCEEHGKSLMMIYNKQRLLREEGDIVWGALVQSNILLHRPGPYDCPAGVIYSPDTAWSDHLLPLLTIAEGVFALKDGGGETDEERAYGKKYVANERPHGMRVEVPKTLTGGREVYSTVVMCHRKHLPGRCLKDNYIPLLIHSRTKATMMVPSRYWPEELLEAWQ